MTNIKEFLDYLNDKQLRGKDLFEQYSEMKNAKKVIEDRIEEINALIMEEMNESGETKRIFDFGGFTIVPKLTWKYSEKVKEEEARVKALKKQEEESGVAVSEEKKYLLFK